MNPGQHTIDRLGGYVPAAPLAEAVAHKLARGNTDEHELAGMVGIDSKAFRNLRERDVVTLDTADRIMVGLGLAMWEVYPEADNKSSTSTTPSQIVTVFCPSCRDQVVPNDDGTCVWCDVQTGGHDIAPLRPCRPPQNAPEAVFVDARALYLSGLNMREVAEALYARTTYVTVDSFRRCLFSGFESRGWPTRGRLGTDAAHYKHGMTVNYTRAKGYGRYLAQRNPTQGQPRCAATNRRGKRCRGFAMRGSDHCYSHAPERRAQVLADLERAWAAAGRNLLPAGPFAAWLYRRRQDFPSTVAFAFHIGWNPSHLRAALSGRDTHGGPQRHFYRRTVHRTLRRDGTTTFREVYP